MVRLPQQETKTLLAIHGWSGVLLGMLLYAVIVTGVASVFGGEIADWSSPLVQRPQHKFPADTDALLKDVANTVPAEFQQDLIVFPRAGGRLYAFFHRDEKDAAGKPINRGVQVDIDPSTRQVIQRVEGTGDDVEEQDHADALSNFFIEMHVRLHLPDPWGLLLTGVLGLAMMVAAVTGFVIHRHLIKELFTLRRHKEKLLSMRDVHVVAGTWNLPFAFILAFTGSFYSFSGSIGIPVMAMIAFGGDQDKAIEAVVGNPPASDPTPHAVANIDAMLADAGRRSNAEVSFLSMEHWGRADAHMSVFMEPAEGKLLGTSYTYNGATGAWLSEKPTLGKVPSAGGTLSALMAPLHFGNFAGVFSKGVWFALGFAGAYVTFTGMLLWTQRRIDQRTWRGFGRAVAWVGYGLPLSLIAVSYVYFPLRDSERDVSGAMMNLFLGVAAISGVLAIVLTPALLRRVLIAASGLLLLGLPLLRWFCDGPSWTQALASGHSVVLSIDVAALLAGALCLVALRRKPAPRNARPSVDARTAGATHA
jgi:uncharacterized iron-regulated membrane protein